MNIDERLGHEAVAGGPFGVFSMGGIAFGAVGIFPLGTEAIEGGKMIPKDVAVAEAAPVFGQKGESSVFGGGSPEGKHLVGGGIAGPRDGFVDDFDADAASGRAIAGGNG